MRLVRTAASDGLLATSFQAAQYFVMVELSPVVDGSLTTASTCVKASRCASTWPWVLSWLRIWKSTNVFRARLISVTWTPVPSWPGVPAELNTGMGYGEVGVTTAD